MSETKKTEQPRYDASRRCYDCGCVSPWAEQCGACETAQRLSERHEQELAAKDAEIARLRAIRDKARAVRAAQKRYFATRSREALVESQRLERELDALIDPAPMLPGMDPK